MIRIAATLASSLLILICCYGGTTGHGLEKAGESKGTAEEEFRALGKHIYEEYCLSCHQTNGSGVPYTFPPIANADWVQGDESYLIRMLLSGISGPLYVNGELYNDEMPAYYYLSDKEIAAVLSYIRQNFGNEADPVSPKSVASIRAEIEAESEETQN